MALAAPTYIMAQERLVGLTSAGGPNGGGTAFSILTNGTGFSMFSAFTTNGGINPRGSLCKGSDGNFYGMTVYGGTNNVGLVFKITPSGSLTILKHLDASTGNYPISNLIQATDGNFYGMTTGGGAYGGGTIFKITLSGAFTVLKNLSDTTGRSPFGSLMQASDGNLYGSANYGGANNQGTVFKITLAGAFTLLKSFDASSGINPRGSFVQGADGALYGVTNGAGAYNGGTIFKITTSGSLTVIKSLDYNTSGISPNSGLVLGTDGYFYGTTPNGGLNYQGTIFKINATGSVFTVLRNMDGTTGGYPFGGLAKGTDGLLYGMSRGGGTYGLGTIFKITNSGTYTVLYNLGGGAATGTNPESKLVQGSDGAFYGLTQTGGKLDKGTFFKITSSGAYTLLWSFPDNGKGYSQSNLMQASNGNFYGTNYLGGTSGLGTAFRLCPSGSFTTVRAYDKASGISPMGTLVQGKDGLLYGTANNAGAYSVGTLYKMTTSGVLTVLKNLDGASGYYPYGGLVAANDTVFYGMAYQGGTYNYGTIFRVSSKGTFAVIKHFDNSTTGGYPKGALVKATDGNFYGMTTSGGSGGYGTIFKLTPSGTLTVIKYLDNTAGSPQASLIQGADGAFYGTTFYGGVSNKGMLFKINSTGSVFTILKTFDGATAGSYPTGSLVQGADGTLYGTASQGGTYDGGTLFKIRPDGTAFAVLRHLNPATDGNLPFGALVIQKPNPVAAPQSFSTVKNAAKKIKLTATGGTPLSYAVSTKPLHGTATVVKDSLIYTPTAGYVGTDSLYFTATWGCQRSAPAKIKITVTATAVTTTTEMRGGFGNGLIAEGTKHLQVIAAPNPSATSFTLYVRSVQPQPAQLRVLDAQGRTVEAQNNLAPNSTISFGADFRPGFYVAEVTQGATKVLVKLVKTTH